MTDPRELAVEAMKGRDEHFCDFGISDYEYWLLADAVIESLGLTEEWGVQRTISNRATPRESESWCRERAEFLNDRYGPGEASIVRRWVSGWSVVGGEPSEPESCAVCGHTEKAHGDGSGRGCYLCGCLAAPIGGEQ